MKKRIEIKKFNYHKAISIVLCIGFTGLSLYNQFGLYKIKIGLIFAWGASGIIESFRLYVLYILFGKDGSRLKLFITGIGYFALAAWCLVANSWAISESININENQIDPVLLSQYHKIKNEIITNIKSDIQKSQKEISNHNYHIAVNIEILKINPDNLKVKAKKAERIIDRDRHIAKIKRLNSEIDKISKYEPRNNAEIQRHAFTTASLYGVNVKFDTIYAGARESGLKSIFGTSEKLEKIIINIALILLIEAGIILTAMNAKNKNHKITKRNLKLSQSKSDNGKSDNQKSQNQEIISQYHELMKHPLYNEWDIDRKKSNQLAPGEMRKFASKAWRVIKKYKKLENQND
jgi:hypothetical protein